MSYMTREPPAGVTYADIDEDDESDYDEDYEQEIEFGEDDEDELQEPIEYIEESEGDEENEQEDDLDEEDSEDEYDGQVEDVDEESEEEELDAGPIALQAGPRSRAQPASVPWKGLAGLPGPTQQSYLELLQQLKKNHRQGLTVLLLGNSSSGKTSTANSLFNETVAAIHPLQAVSSRPQAIRRTAQGFDLTIIDTPSLVDGDEVSRSALMVLSDIVRRHEIDVVLYFDRLDVYRVDHIDEETMAGITDTFGPDIWENTIIALTHAKTKAPHVDSNEKQEEYMAKRAQALRKAMRGAGARKQAALPAAFIENSSHCDRNAAGEKVIGFNKDRRWLAELMTQVVSVAESVPSYELPPNFAKTKNPNRRKRWLIPFVLAAQVAFKIFVLDKYLLLDAAKDATPENSDGFKSEYDILLNYNRLHQQQVDDKAERRERKAHPEKFQGSKFAKAVKKPAVARAVIPEAEFGDPDSIGGLFGSGLELGGPQQAGTTTSADQQGKQSDQTGKSSDQQGKSSDQKGNSADQKGKPADQKDGRQPNQRRANVSRK